MKVSDIAKLLHGEVHGDPNFVIDHVSSVKHARTGGAALLYSKKDFKALSETSADVIIGHSGVLEYLSTKKAIIVVKRLEVDSLNAFLRTYKAMKYKLFDQANTSEIDGVYIGKHCTIGQNCFFAQGVKIMNGVSIGDNVAINANTVIKEGTIIGDNVTIDSNCSIGNFSFQYMKSHTMRYERVESVGRVIIEGNVDIGCNNTIDRGSFGDTIIGFGTKIDNQVQIGHDCEIGSHCLLVSQCGLAGHTILGDNVVIQGQVGTAGNLSIGSNSIVKAKSGVSRSFPANSDIFGYPAKNTKDYLKSLSALNALSKKPRKNNKTEPTETIEKASIFRRLFNIK